MLSRLEADDQAGGYPPVGQATGRQHVIAFSRAKGRGHVNAFAIVRRVTPADRRAIELRYERLGNSTAQTT